MSDWYAGWNTGQMSYEGVSPSYAASRYVVLTGYSCGRVIPLLFPFPVQGVR